MGHRGTFSVINGIILFINGIIIRLTDGIIRLLMAGGLARVPGPPLEGGGGTTIMKMISKVSRNHAKWSLKS